MDNKETRDLMVYLDLRVPLECQGKRDHQESKAYLGCLDLMALQDIQGERVLLERRAYRVSLAHLVL